MESLKTLYPFDSKLSMDPIGLDERTEPAVASLKLAREAEKTGLESLAQIVEFLGDD